MYFLVSSPLSFRPYRATRPAHTRLVIAVIGLVFHLAFLLILIQAGCVDFVASHERQLARPAAKLFPDEFTVDYLLDGILVALLADVFASLFAGHERAAFACRAALGPNLVVASFKEASLMLWLPQLRFGCKAFPFGLLQRLEFFLGSFDAKLDGRIAR